MIYLANDKFFCSLMQGYTFGDTVLYVNVVPVNVPTILVGNKGTENEIILAITGKSASTLTGVSFLKGAEVNMLQGTFLYCLNNEEFINQYKTFLGLAWKGEWDSGTTYAIDDAVSHNGTSYACIAASTNNEPPNGTYWVVVSAKGEVGATGATGPTGPAGTVDNASGITLQEIVTPASPATGYLKVYAKDGKLYYLDSDGVEKAVGSGGGSILEVQVFS